MEASTPTIQHDNASNLTISSNIMNDREGGKPEGTQPKIGGGRGGRGRGGRGRGGGGRGGRSGSRGGGGRSGRGRIPHHHHQQQQFYHHATYPQCHPNDGAIGVLYPNPITNFNKTYMNNTTIDNKIYDNTNNKSHMPICTFYLAGRCNVGGLNCKFFHPHPNHEVLNERQRLKLLQNLSSPTTATTSSLSSHLTNQQTQNKNSNNNTNNPNKHPHYKRKSAPREFDPYKAEAINIAKTAQDMEILTFGTFKGPFYSMDIECVACGYGHSNLQRYPCRISLVKDVLSHDNNTDSPSSSNSNSNENNDNDNVSKQEQEKEDTIEIVLDEIVNLNNIKVASYMTALTGMTSDQCLNPTNKTLEEIRDAVKQHLPKDCILVGHSIQHDIDWLGLEAGVDFKTYIDTSCMFRQRIPKNLGSASNVLRNQVNNNSTSGGGDSAASSSSSSSTNDQKNENDNGATQESNQNKNKEVMNSTNNNSKISKADDYDQPDDTHLPFPTKYRLFSLRHCCIHLLDIDIQEKAHNPIMDAKYSLILFKKYQYASPQYLRALRDSLHRAPPTPSFAAENPIVDGVVLSLAGYKLKWAGRFIWKWWLEKRRGKE